MVLVGPIPSALSDGGVRTRNGNGNEIVCVLFVVCLSRCIVFSLLFSVHFSSNFSRISFFFFALSEMSKERRPKSSRTRIEHWEYRHKIDSKHRVKDFFVSLEWQIWQFLTVCPSFYCWSNRKQHQRLAHFPLPLFRMCDGEMVRLLLLNGCVGIVV